MLAGRLARHPEIVSPSIKEPNYFSSRLERGDAWYAGLYPSTDGQWMDASAQYTFPRYLDALDRAEGSWQRAIDGVGGNRVASL